MSRHTSSCEHQSKSPGCLPADLTTHTRANAGADACRLQELDAKADSYQPAPGTSPGNAAFDSLSQNLDLQADAAHGVQRVVAKFQPQLYGQFEVAARVSVHPAVITSIDVS